MSVPRDILKPEDVVSEFCPYKKTLEGMTQGNLLNLLVDYANKVENGEISCEHITNGTCGLAAFALEQATLDSNQD